MSNEKCAFDRAISRRAAELSEQFWLVDTLSVPHILDQDTFLVWKKSGVLHVPNPHNVPGVQLVALLHTGFQHKKIMFTVELSLEKDGKPYDHRHLSWNGLVVWKHSVSDIKQIEALGNHINHGVENLEEALSVEQTRLERLPYVLR